MKRGPVSDQKVPFQTPPLPPPVLQGYRREWKGPPQRGSPLPQTLQGSPPSQTHSPLPYPHQTPVHPLSPDLPPENLPL